MSNTGSQQTPFGRDSAPRQSLGVLSIIGDSFSMLFRKFFLLFGIAFALLAIVFILNIVIFGGPANTVRGLQAQSPLLIFMSSLLAFAAYTLAIGVISLATFDVKTGKRVRLAAYFKHSAKCIMPIFALMIAASLLAVLPMFVGFFLTGIQPMLGFVAIPVGLTFTIYIFGMCSLTNPAIVIEDAGFGGLKRSVELTSGYRWSVLGLFAILALLLFIIGIVASLIVGGILVSMTTQIAAGESSNSVVAFQLVNLVSGSLFLAFSSVLITLLFARLKEIKEGYAYEDFGSVFE